MKSYSIGLVVGFSLLALSLAAPTLDSSQLQSFNECTGSATDQIQKKVRELIEAKHINVLAVKREEKCHFQCFLQKIGVCDENGNMKSEELVTFTLEQSPELEKYRDALDERTSSPIITTQIFGDKCHKVFMAYNAFAKYAQKLKLEAQAQEQKSETTSQSSPIETTSQKSSPETTSQISQSDATSQRSAISQQQVKPVVFLYSSKTEFIWSSN